VDVTLAHEVYDPQIPIDVQPRRTHTRDMSIRRDLAELQRLVRILHRHAAVGVEDHTRDLDVLDENRRIGRAEPHLRAVAALLVTLDAYQHLTVTKRRPVRDAATQQQPPVPTLVRPVNGQAADHAAPTSTGLDTDLAAAAARYIARDLAARQLSEFTSAEGYRLARALARLGQAEAPVEQLLSDANQVRLHPMPLTDALSHSPH
jgi:hypothetical protein